MPKLDEDSEMRNEELMEINNVGKNDDRQVSEVHNTISTINDTSIKTEDTPTANENNPEDDEKLLGSMHVGDITVTCRVNQQHSINEQLALIREVKQLNFENINGQVPGKNEKEKNFQCDDIVLWPENTVLITGDSMLCGLEEKRLSNKFNVKVRPHHGANIDDMYYDYLNPYLRKQPKYLIIHIATNDASIKDKTSDIIFQQILKLRRYVVNCIGLVLEPFLNLNLNVEMCFSNPASLALDPLAASFNYVSRIVLVLPHCFTNLMGLSGSTNKISNLDPLAEPFIPGIIPDNCLLGGVCISRSTRNCSPGGNSNIVPITLGSLFEQDDEVGSPAPPDHLTPTRWADVSIHVKSSRKINGVCLETAVGGISNSKACLYQNVNEKNPVTSFSNLNPYAEPFPASVNTGIPRNIPSGNNKESAYSYFTKSAGKKCQQNFTWTHKHK